VGWNLRTEKKFSRSEKKVFTVRVQRSGSHAYTCVNAIAAGAYMSTLIL